MDCKTLDGLTKADGQAFINQLSPHFSIDPPNFQIVDDGEMNARALEHENIIEISKELFTKLNRDELIGILCHELAHFHFGHSKNFKSGIWRLIFNLILLLPSIPYFYVIWFYPSLLNVISFVFFCFGWTHLVVHTFPELMYIKFRKNEFQADAKAVEVCGPLCLIKSLIKLHCLRIGSDVTLSSEFEYVAFAASLHDECEKNKPKGWVFGLTHPPIHKRLYKIFQNCYMVKD